MVLKEGKHSTLCSTGRMLALVDCGKSDICLYLE